MFFLYLKIRKKTWVLSGELWMEQPLIMNNFRTKRVWGLSWRKGEKKFLKFLNNFLQIYCSHFCGAFIITDRWIGTAGNWFRFTISQWPFHDCCSIPAHCTRGRIASSFVAVLGALSRSYEGTTMPIMRVVSHPDYDVRVQWPQNGGCP